jgi:predicted ATPase
MVKIKELRLQHFRAFTNARFVLDDQLTVVIGRNGSGKSTLMDAFDFIRSALTDSLVTAIERRGGRVAISQRLTNSLESQGSQSISLDLILEIEGCTVSYGFKLRSSAGSDDEVGTILEEETLLTSTGTDWFRRDEGGFHTDVKGIAPSIAANSLALPLVAGSVELWGKIIDAIRHVHTYSFLPAAISREQEIENSTELEKTGGNAGDVLKHLETYSPSKVDWIKQYLRRVTSGIVDVFTMRPYNGFRRVAFGQVGGETIVNIFPATQMSDGTLRSFSILLALQQEPTPSLVFIDEVEDSLHPGAIAVLLDAIDVCTEQFQVVISSHNPELLSNYPVIRPERVRSIKWAKGESNVYPLSERIIAEAVPPYTVGLLMSENALYTSEVPTQVESDFFGVAK